jgi:hypothetical protein
MMVIDTGQTCHNICRKWTGVTGHKPNCRLSKLVQRVTVTRGCRIIMVQDDLHDLYLAQKPPPTIPSLSHMNQP